MSTKKLQILGSLGSGSSVTIDPTFTQADKAADAKATGDKFSSLETQINDMDTLVGDISVADQISSAIESANSLSSRTNVVLFKLVADGNTDNSAALQELLETHRVLYFPPGTYRFKNIELPSNTDIIFDDAVIDVEAANDFIFTASGADKITIKGGKFRRMNDARTICHNASSGIFKFENCSNIHIEQVTFADSMTMCNVRCVDCKNVEITLCKTEAYHGMNFGFLNDCENIYIHDCEINNGTNLGYDYMYGVASGFTDYTNEYYGITNFIVENCIFNYSDWECIDSHGGMNIRIVNNRIINAYRWITAYADERPVIRPGTKWGNVLIEGNYCANDKDVSFAPAERDYSILLHGSHATNRKQHGIRLEHNVFVNPVINNRFGLISAYFADNLIVKDNEFLFEIVPAEVSYLIRLMYNNNVCYEGNKFIGHSANTSVFRLYQSKAEIKNNLCVSAPEVSTLGLVEGFSGTFYYTNLSGNTGNYGVDNRTPYSSLFAPGDLIQNSSGLTGYVAKLSEPGLRRLNAHDAITGTVQFVDGKTSTSYIYVENAIDKLLSGVFVQVDIGSKQYSGVISDIDWNGFTISTLIDTSGDATISFPIHTQTQVSQDLIIQANGTTLGNYNGSVEKTFNITPSNIGAATIEQYNSIIARVGDTSVSDQISNAIDDYYTKTETDAFLDEKINKEDYLGPIIKEGNPIVYENGVEGFDIKVETTFGPKQTGGGDPYPVGGGKNLFYVAPKTAGGITVSKNADGSYVLNGTAASIQMIQTNCSYPEGTYILSSQSLPQGVYVRIRDAAGTILGTNNIESTLVHMFTGTPGICEFTIAANTTLDNVVIKPQLEKGETATDWEPCENIRLITGYDTLKLAAAGANLAPTHKDLAGDAGLTYSILDGKLTISGTATKNIRLDTDKIILPPGQYTLAPNNSVPADIALYMRKPDGTKFGSISLASSTTAKHTFTLTEATEACVSMYINSGAVLDVTVAIMLNIGAVKEFVPYVGNIYTAQIGQTVYGGKFDWLTGKLIVDRALKTFDGSENWKTSNTNTSGKSRFSATGLGLDILPPPNTSTVAEGLVCSHYKAAPSTTGGTYQCVQSCGVYTSGTVYFYDEQYATKTADDWKAYVAAQYAAGTPIQFTYKLKTPIEIQLTPTQISELEGINTLYGDGDNIRAIFKSTGGTSTTLETISGVLPVEKGGTGATSAAGARNNLGITPANIGAIATTGGTIKGNLTFGEYNKGTGALYLNILRAVNDVDYRMRLYVNGSTGAASIQSHCGSDELNHMYLNADATEFKMPVAVGSGGTGATDAATARSNLGITPANIGAATAAQYNSLSSLVGDTAVSTQISSYAPSKTGSGASGNWDINITGSSASCTGNAATATTLSATLAINKGGTGATTAAQARTNLGITPANIGAVKKSGDTMTGELNLNALGSTDAVYLTANRVVGDVQYKSRFYINGDTGSVNIQLRNNDTGDEINKLTLGLTETTFKKAVAVNSGGTGITSNPSMLVNLGSTSAASVFAASPRPGITGTLGIGNGGTGATSKSSARTNLGITSGTSLPSSASAGDIFFLYS